MAEDKGFDIIECESASTDLLLSVESYISEELKQSHNSGSLNWRKVKWNAICEELFHHGWNVRFPTTSILYF